MKFKILKGTETFQKLTDLKSEMNRCNSEASSLSKSLGGCIKGTHLGKGYGCISGGLAGIKMETKPDGWKNASTQYYGFYIPKINKANKHLLDRIELLPTVRHEDLNAIVGFEMQSSGRRWFNCPGVHWTKEYVLLEVDNECDFTPNCDMIEILESEYVKLIGKKD